VSNPAVSIFPSNSSDCGIFKLEGEWILLGSKGHKAAVGLQPLLGFRLNRIEKRFEVRLDLPRIGSLIDRHDEAFRFFRTSPI
jgi:hypothetical protein